MVVKEPGAPAHWIAELARADEELARGEPVAASLVHDDLRRALEELEAELADADQPAADQRNR